jgi:glutathione S-transferase
MKLYGFPGSPNTWKVRAAAHQMGLPLELEFVDLTKGAQRRPEYLALNPTGRTPTLVDGDLKLWESSAIMQYLGSKTSTALWPDDARSRADIMRWQSWHLQHWSRGCSGLLFENLVKQVLNMGPPDQRVLAQATDTFHADAAVLDKHLEGRRYLVDDTLTLADFTVVAPLLHAERAKMPIEKYGNIRRWLGTQAALPAWKETAPQLSS